MAARMREMCTSSERVRRLPAARLLQHGPDRIARQHPGPGHCAPAARAAQTVGRGDEAAARPQGLTRSDRIPTQPARTAVPHFGWRLVPRRRGSLSPVPSSRGSMAWAQIVNRHPDRADKRDPWIAARGGHQIGVRIALMRPAPSRTSMSGSSVRSRMRQFETLARDWRAMPEPPLGAITTSTPYRRASVTISARRGFIFE